jgi:outer membrane protein assembly factor BamD
LAAVPSGVAVTPAAETDIMGLIPTDFTLRRTLLAPLFAVLGIVALAGCSSDKELEYKELSVYEIYSQAVLYLEQDRYTEAAKYFDEVERQHPYSVWATTAKLMSAYAHYHASEYAEAVTRLERFISVHPGNRDIAYAYYLKALCYYEQIADVRRDQEETRKALDSLQDVVTRFPSTPYGRDARLKLDLTRDHLAGKEMDVARFYLNSRHYLAAINRFKAVVEIYSTTSHVPEALHRLVESYTALGLVDEARKSAAVLGYNFPNNEWYRDSYGLARVSEKRVAKAEADPNPPSEMMPVPPDGSPKSAQPTANPALETEKLSQPPQPTDSMGNPNSVPEVKKKPWYKFW